MKDKEDQVGQSSDAYDVIVGSGGNAGLCAALSAQEPGARILVVEKAPESWRGGSTFFTAGGYRLAFNSLEQIRALIPDLSDAEWESIELDPYPEDEYFDDLMRVTEDLADPDLAMLLIRQSLPTMHWLREKGVRWLLMFGRQAYAELVLPDAGIWSLVRRVGPDHSGAETDRLRWGGEHRARRCLLLQR